jgi:hypothetical protein
LSKFKEGKLGAKNIYAKCLAQNIWRKNPSEELYKRKIIEKFEVMIIIVIV